MIINKSTEIQEQEALFKLAATNRITAHYLIANNHADALGPKMGAILARRGLKADTPDLFLAYPVGSYSGLWVELKRVHPKRGVLRAGQKEFMQRLRNVGYAAAPAWGWQEAWNMILKYLAGGLIIVGESGIYEI